VEEEKEKGDKEKEEEGMIKGRMNENN